MSKTKMTDATYSYEIMNIDGACACWVVPDGLDQLDSCWAVADFTRKTGVDLVTLRKHEASGDPLTLNGYQGLWTVGACDPTHLTQ